MPTPKNPSPPKNKGGRPFAKIDLKELERLCSLSCTDEELAHYFGITTRTIENYRLKPEYKEAMERGKASGRLSLRRSQFRAAVEDHNPTMLIWLGKQLLGQKDRQEIDMNMRPHEDTLDDLA